MKYWDFWVRALTFSAFVGILVVQKVQLWLMLFLIMLVLARWLGRLYCGYICPMNSAMLVADWLKKMFKIKERRQPGFLSFRHLSWIMLAVMISLMAVSQFVLKKPLPILPVLVVSAFFVALFYYPSFFHNYLCPFHAPLALFGSKAVFSKQVSQNRCIGCTKCEKVCPSLAVTVDRQSRKASIDTALCHQCQSCTRVCPTYTIRYQKVR